jgi:hypothetical protein
MNAYSELVAWIGVTDLEHLDHSRGMGMVKAALDFLGGNETEESRIVLQDLQPIHDDFLGGGLPADQLRKFYEHYRDSVTEPTDPPGLILEDEFRQLAEDLSEEEWCTGSFLKLEAGIEAYMNGDFRRLEDAIYDLEDVLQQAWEPYAESPVTASEVTAETVLGHQLLVEGIQEWQQALELTRAAANEEAEWQDALDCAQYANRILVALQKFSDRIQRAV